MLNQHCFVIIAAYSRLTGCLIGCPVDCLRLRGPIWMLFSVIDALRAAGDAHSTSRHVLIKVLEPPETTFGVCRATLRDVFDPVARYA